MIHRSIVLMAVFFLFVAPSESLGEYGNGLGGADYQYAWARATGPAFSDEDDDPVYATADGSCWFSWLTDHEQIESHALGQVVANNQGINKAWCSVNQRDFASPEGGGLECGADVETFTPFRFTSEALNPGDTITVDLTVSVDGSLLAHEGGTAADMQSHAHVGVLIGILEMPSEQVIFEQEGDAYWYSTYNGSDIDYTLDAAGFLASACTMAGDTCTVSYTDTLTFEAKVDQIYWFYFDLATGVSCSDIPEGYDDNLTTLATSDFYHTSSYSLTTLDDADFVVVPEPTSVALLGFGGILSLIGLARWRKR